MGSLKYRQAQHKRKTQRFYLGKPRGRKPSNFFCIDSSLSTMLDKDRKPKDKMTSAASSSLTPANLSCVVVCPNEGESLPIYILQLGDLFP